MIVPVAVVLGLAGCSLSGSPTVSTSSPSAPSGASAARAAPDPALATFYEQTLDWQPCESGDYCAKLTVPLDYANPAGDTIELALLKNPAPGGDSRPPLVINPGGPGASGVDFAKNIDGSIPESVRDAFDIVGFDPRGVGESNPLDCLTDKQTDSFLAADGDPDTQAEVQALINEAQVLAQGCKQAGSQLERHISTAEVAKDMDILRAALEQPTLDYLGFSYGTLIGATYAGQFPTRVGRFVLDGAIDPQLSNTELARGQAHGFEVALTHYIANCVKGGNCPLGNTTQAATARLRTFLADVDAKPLPTTSGRRLTGALALSAVIYPLYQPSYGWPMLTSALASALEGDGSQMLSINDLFTQRNADGSYEGNSLDALYAVNCIDHPDRPGPDETAALAQQWSQQDPFFGAALAYGNLACHYWQAPATGAPAPIAAAGSPEILVIGTEFDPATPYPWAQSLAAQLDNGRLLTWQGGEGHTALHHGSACIDTTVEAFLIQGVVPPDGKVCT